MRCKVKKGILLIVGLTVSMKMLAAETIDVYGLDEQSAQKIINQYSKEIEEIEPMMSRELSQLKSSDEVSKSLEKKMYRKHEIQQEIIKKYGYLFVEIQTVFYPDEERYYTTIEVVDKQHPERMRFVSKHQSNKEKTSSHEPDLIDAMNEYNEISLKMVINHQLIPSQKCPVFHCVVGFGHAKLKPYLTMFNEGAVKQKKLIIETLKYDKDPERRAAAAFLVGHFTDPKEILSILTPCVADRSEGVRNNVMRVIGTTMAKAKISKIDVKPFLKILDAPYITDRNKALYVLDNAAEDKETGTIILNKAGRKLLALLQLQQPDNHEIAYLLLKKISGKDFGSTNIGAWKNWYEQYQVENQLV